MRLRIALIVGLFSFTLNSFSQSLETDLQFLLDNFPSIHDMKKERMWRDGKTTTYLFKNTKTKELLIEYQRIYYYGSEKYCFDHFTIEKKNKRYRLTCDDGIDNATFHVETRSNSKEKWQKSKEIKIDKTKLSSNIKFTLSFSQGTLSSLR
jgi:hypothetical protein